MHVPEISMKRAMGFVVMAAAVACGGDDSSDPIDANPSPIDGSPEIDAASPPPIDSSPEPDAANPSNDGGVDADPGAIMCSEGRSATSNRYLPFDVGNSWIYRIDAFDGNPPALQRLRFDALITPDEASGEVMVELTEQADGSTERWLQLQDQRVVILRQRDFDVQGNLERVTTYQPYRLLLDESAASLVEGASWTENHVREVQIGSEAPTRDTVSEQWEVAGVGGACPTPWESQQCVELEITTISGGSGQRSVWFARSYGKIREEGGSQAMELFDCNLQ